MNSKTLIGGLLGGIVAFAAGYVIYGLLLKEFFNDHMTHYPRAHERPT